MNHAIYLWVNFSTENQKKLRQKKIYQVEYKVIMSLSFTYNFYFVPNPHLFTYIHIVKKNLPELFRFDPFLFERLYVLDEENEALGIL